MPMCRSARLPLEAATRGSASWPARTRRWRPATRRWRSSLADSVLFSIDADAARGRVLLFLASRFVPFLFVAPLIGPAIDRMAGGRRLVIQIVTAAAHRASRSRWRSTSTRLLLFPLAFGAMVLQKTYAISKSALVPSVVRSDEELVEANSKLGPDLGPDRVRRGAARRPRCRSCSARRPRCCTRRPSSAWRCVSATRLPREVVAARSAGRTERAELHAPGVVLASSAMLLARATVGLHLLPPVLLVPAPGRRADLVRSVDRLRQLADHGRQRASRRACASACARRPC